MAGISHSENLKRLLSADLDFKGENGNYASHNFHAFAAKFPPQLPRFFIERLTRPGEVVLDPMMGSGTTIVEAMIAGRKSIGYDIDPLAIQIASIKTAKLKKNEIQRAYSELMDDIEYVLRNSPQAEEELEKRFDADTKAFLDYWFFPETQKELMTILLGIERLPANNIRDFFKLAFSSIIITKSGGVSRARDLAHTRPHLDKTKIPRSAMEAFSQRVSKLSNSLNEFTDAFEKPAIKQCDAKNIPLQDSSIDLVVTSPPYANAIDYMRAHKFSLVWSGSPLKTLADLRSRYIGAERSSNSDPEGLPESARKIIETIAQLDPAKARVLIKYFNEMQEVFAQIFRVLKPSKNAIVVVGSSTIRGIDVKTHISLAEIAEGIGFERIGIAQRLIDRNKRMMPARFGNKKSSQIEMRMHEEYVIGLEKPANLI